MLDMIPYMTGKGDMPPLYMLYAVVVHLDTQNASFSGHYVSYVRNLRGNWFRIDDTEVTSLNICNLEVFEIEFHLIKMLLVNFLFSTQPQNVGPNK